MVLKGNCGHGKIWLNGVFLTPRGISLYKLHICSIKSSFKLKLLCSEFKTDQLVDSLTWLAGKISKQSLGWFDGFDKHKSRQHRTPVCSRAERHFMVFSNETWKSDENHCQKLGWIFSSDTEDLKTSLIMSPRPIMRPIQNGQPRHSKISFNICSHSLVRLSFSCKIRQ